MKPWQYQAKPAFSLNADNSQTNESKSHNLISNDATELGEESSRKSDEVNQTKVTEAFTPEKVKVPDQAQNSPLPLINEGSGETADNTHWQPAGETTPGGSEGVLSRDTLADVPKSAQKVYEIYGTLPVALPPILLLNLMAWVAKFYELRLEHPSGLILAARPEHVRDAVKLHPWGVVYDPERYLLMSWGDVPAWALMGKRDLETGELLIPEAVAA